MKEGTSPHTPCQASSFHVPVAWVDTAPPTLPSSPHTAVRPDVASTSSSQVKTLTLSLGSPLEDRLGRQTNPLVTKSLAVVISGMGLLLIPELIPHGSETRIIHSACSINHVLQGECCDASHTPGNFANAVMERTFYNPVLNCKITYPESSFPVQVFIMINQIFYLCGWF